MRLDFANERILAVVAHPDDAELLCAGTLARAKVDGATIGICVLCQGDKGQPEPPVENLAEVRAVEMTKAAEIVGARLFQAGFADGELFDGQEQRTVLVEIYRRFCPTLVFAHASQDYHADHQAASKLSEAASWFCASAGHVTDSKALDAPPSLWHMDTVNMIGFSAGFYLDVTDYLDVKREMIRCHKSQMVRGGNRDFAPLEELMTRQAAVRGAQADVVAAEAFQNHLAWSRVCHGEW